MRQVILVPIITSLGKTKILVADNHLLTREGIKALLQENDQFSIIGEANDGMELHHKLQQLKPDVVIIDYDMPGFFEAPDIQKIYKQHPGTGVLVVTTNQNKKDILQVLEFGVNNYILKICDKEEFTGALDATIRQEKFFCGKVIDAILEKHFPKKQHCDAPTLSQRETEIVQFIAQGYTNSQMAEALFLSIHTVSTHRKNILRKLHIKSTSELVLYAIKTGIVESPEKTN